MIRPYNKYLIMWNLLMTLGYLVAIFTDSLIIAFHLNPLLDPTFCRFQTALSFLMLIDIVLKFFTAIRSSQNDFVEQEEFDDDAASVIGKTTKVAAEE